MWWLGSTYSKSQFSYINLQSCFPSCILVLVFPSIAGFGGWFCTHQRVIVLLTINNRVLNSTSWYFSQYKVTQFWRYISVWSQHVCLPNTFGQSQKMWVWSPIWPQPLQHNSDEPSECRGHLKYCSGLPIKFILSWAFSGFMTTQAHPFQIFVYNYYIGFQFPLFFDVSSGESSCSIL